MHEKLRVQLGITQGRKFRWRSVLERVCFHPGSHSHSVKKVIFPLGLHVPLPHCTSLHTSSATGARRGEKTLPRASVGSRTEITARQAAAAAAAAATAEAIADQEAKLSKYCGAATR